MTSQLKSRTTPTQSWRSAGAEVAQPSRQPESITRRRANRPTESVPSNPGVTWTDGERTSRDSYIEGLIFGAAGAVLAIIVIAILAVANAS